MAFAKRIFLFLLLNFLVILMISVILHLFHVGPVLTSYGLNYKELLIFCFVWGMAGALISLALSRIMAKWMMGVKTVDPDTRDPQLRQLVDTIYTLSRDANLPMPEVGIYHSAEVNAFATGPTRSRSLVAVSTGLLNKMQSQELKGVLGHEISHIANGDMVTMTLLQGVVNAFVMFLARVLAYVVSGLGRNREEGRGSVGSYILFTYLFEVVFMILGSILIAFYSRFREFRADRGGAQLAGKTSMISALEKLQALQSIKDPRAENPALAAFKISHPGKAGLMRLFATHPPLEERIERLKTEHYTG